MEILRGKREKKLKRKSRKAENNKADAIEILDVENLGRRKVVEGNQGLERDVIAEIEQDDMETVKKENKAKKDAKGTKMEEEKSTNENQVFGMCSEDLSPDALKKVEKKRRKLQKNKNVDKQSPETENMAKMKSGKEVEKGIKSKTKGKDHKDGYTENKGRKKVRKEIGTCSEIREVNALERVVGEKKRKREKKRSKDDGSGENDTLTAASVVFRTDDDSNTNKIMDGEKRSKNMVETFIEGQDGVFSKKVEKTKKRKIRKEENEKSMLQQDVLTEATVDAEGDVVEKTVMKKKKKRKRKENPTEYLSDIEQEGNGHLSMDETRDNELENENKGKKKKPKLVENGLDGTKTKNSNKKVRFSSHVEVFPPTDDLNAVTGNDEEDNLVRGKRFTREEDKIVEAAVFKYIEEHDLGEEGLKKVLNSRKYPEVRNCWKEIGSAIPYRPYNAVYFRAQILFRRSDTRKWTEEEYEMVRECQKEHGNRWRALADELGKHSWHVKDAWRRIKLPNAKKGHWSQEEYQGLFDLVNADLQRRVSEEKRSKHGMLRDNICWTAISDKLSTRNQANCCMKWYKQLTSPMVAEGMWADVDDYRLLSVLYNLDSTCIEDVDWDNLLDDRSGDLCRMRWNQMVLHIGKHGTKSFAEQVEVLAQRYCPDLLEAREAWDRKPRVP
ncbi:DNA-binding protein REB1-like [Olea europaea var. sylvestris]|uniref:DNA-binding protein REB1-like n=1 Tax=Olea europaea var. sylvestris TaxID=158386 RepID=UPI000C1D21D9|nr:DNA-binding protein REB1-like [Olea europaea var. sylvestris]XP_022869745.1 DNA-binding protein REB1-like [Olea europaea var. sylvestris]XP_022869746.1 DNA-binding protein REB1-like [Olea europaea var. sylvestris]XP_022869747.1 DNA-binding protein REB1-like [Olea europaea var. sylvestris]XP_022869748.1 DNA-binding protein REB1-like [Olea europaea var. sylvestris]XP_022869749.1 DNA-binding protein REB1-like [Olea europaea var. sylvestris]XP_022869750.1 DNA-binding protein REB1-like [Olea eu